MPLVCAYAISVGMWEVWVKRIYQIWGIRPREASPLPTK
jgi:hypothetical protein